ncbi:MAG: hypothetical protein P3B98_00140 [Gemmatimonadota bacterium]|nr:hypothetical protein [Gemmatimonadota bacterium]
MRMLLHTTIAALTVFGAPTLRAQASTPGFFVETRITAVSRGGSNANTRTRVTRAWTSAGCSRTEGEPYRGDSTAYQLVIGTPRTFLNVVPRDRTVFTVGASTAKPLVADAKKVLGPMPAVSPWRLVGDGGTVLGHRTRKFEMKSTTRTRAGGTEVASAPTVTTYWVADDAADPMVVAYRALRPAILAGEPGATGAGMVLRSETHRQWQRDVTQVTTREVTVWRQEQVPASRCDIPAGYRRVDLAADLRAQQAASAELRRLSQSPKPADQARARALGDSLLKEIRRTAPAPRPLREDPRAVRIDGTGTKKP